MTNPPPASSCLGPATEHLHAHAAEEVVSNSITRQRRLRFGAALSLTILTIVGCAHPSSATRTRPKPATLNEIPRPEIEVAMTRYSNAFEMVRALRPNMLAAHGLAAGPQSR